jgi:exopolysaccharide biosynthesis polyprenyl glycosylphosphotransferase
MYQQEIIIREDVVDEIIYAMPLKDIEDADSYIEDAEKMGVSVRIIPDWQIYSLMYSPDIATVNFEDFLGIPTMALKTTPTSQSALLVKALVDYISAGIALILLFPFFISVAIGIKVFSKGPVFFTQVRSGLNGRKFKIYKFRTMVADAESIREKLEHLNETDGPVFKIKKDPRIIPYIGTLLRKTGLDEIPQLINIIRGEMSLVGPRPPLPSEVDKYDRWQRRRLSMKPGLTCLWQIAPNRNDVSFEDWMKMDLKYIDSWSLSLDMRLLFLTVGTVIWGEGR